MTQASENAEKIIVVDWGTTSLRAALVGRSGEIIHHLETSQGVQFIEGGLFEAGLMDAIGGWLDRYGSIPVVASGMITSRSGWIEVPYVTCPASIEDLASGAVHRTLPNGSKLVLLTGITDQTRQPFPDVMRGEETQIVGFGFSKQSVVVLPSTHSKWACLKNGQIHGFQTFVTGEIFALLSQHSFIAKAAGRQPEEENWPAFCKGLEIAQSLTGSNVAFLTQLFAARTGMLAGELPANEMRDFISGILIGNEFRQALACGLTAPGDTIGIVGNDGLNERYMRAACCFGLSASEMGGQAAIDGAIQIYSAMPSTKGDLPANPKVPNQ